jgi:signal transduction histidine kinase/DNA-binding response OmpR family regulator
MAMAQSVKPASAPSKASIRILIVDDDPEARSALNKLLGQDGYTLDIAEGGISALDIACARAPDVVITDLRMPGMDGIELLARLKERNSELPVIVVTSLGDVESAVAAMRAGAEDYLPKPIDINALGFVIERALERRNLRLDANHMRRQILVQHERLRHLYHISKQLTRFESIARTVPAVLASLSASVPLLSAILITELRAVPENRIHAIAWHAEGVSALHLDRAKAHANEAYAYLVRKSSLVEEESGARRLPSTPPPPSGARKSGFVLLPLVAENRAIFGALQVEGTAGLDEGDLTFLNAVVNQLAITLDRVAAIESKQEAAQAGQRAAEFLAEASATLFSSLEYESTIAAIVRAAIPPLGETCFLDRIGEDQRLHRVAIRSADPNKGSAPQGGPTEDAPDSKSPQAQALRSGTSVPAASFDTPSDSSDRVRTGGDGAVSGRSAPSEERGASSMMAVPLIARGRRLGVLTFVDTQREGGYSASDFALAEEIGRRAAIAIDNAELYEQAQSAIRARQDLLAIVSHDLKNPLGAILMATALLQNAKPTERLATQNDPIYMIERAVHRMTRLIDDLLDMASIESGHLSVEVQRHQVATLVSEAVELNAVAAAQNQLQLERILPGAQLVVDCDRGRILQVFSNLIGNAIKFTPRDGSIEVRAESRGKEMLFSVVDSGPGIEPGELSHVFDRFWQAEKTQRLGTGLGLTIAKALVEAHGGRIWVESTVGRGATFFFTIPAFAADVRPAARLDTTNEPSPRRAQANERLL